jgi:hypothetical protein
MELASGSLRRAEIFEMSKCTGKFASVSIGSRSNEVASDGGSGSGGGAI